MRFLWSAEGDAMLVNPFLTPGEQERFRSVTIGVAGAGGLGSNVLMHLVRSGLERFVIADFDRVSPGNLNRQFFFQDQVGQLKTEAVAENLRRINPDLSLQLHPVRITEENLWSVFGQCDLLVEAFDDAESKSMFIRKTVPWGRPVVAASGLAGWGRSNEMRVRKVGKNLYLVGDLSAGVGDLPPESPRVGLAAALEANTAAALILGVEF